MRPRAHQSTCSQLNRVERYETDSAYRRGDSHWLAGVRLSVGTEERSENINECKALASRPYRRSLYSRRVCMTLRESRPSFDRDLSRFLAGRA